MNQPTPAWTPLRYHAKQDSAYRSTMRYRVLACGRGSGKTELARRWLVRQLPLIKPWRDAMYFFALPTINQAKRVAWEKILPLIPPRWIKKTNITDLHVRTVFGGHLFIVGMDKPQRVEGSEWDAGILDECCDQRPGVFSRTLMPTFAHRQGQCWLIGAPKRQGIGAVDFKQLFDRGESGEDEEMVSYSWPSSDIMLPSEIEAARQRMDEYDFEEQYNANWKEARGGIFHSFDELCNVSWDVQYTPGQPIIVGSDFNVDPMCWILAHKVVFKQGDSKGLEGLAVFDEVFRRNTNTQSTLDYLHDQYVTQRSHRGGWVFIGDATGRARKTAASATDYIQIYNDNRFVDRFVRYPQANPPVMDRFSATNALLCNANRKRRLFIHPRCKRLIQDLQSRAYKPGTREPNDIGDIGHMTDALGYVCYMLYPPVVVQESVQQVSVYNAPTSTPTSSR